MQMFSDASQAVLSVTSSFILKSGQRIFVYFVSKRKFFLLVWPHLFYQIFMLNRQTFCFLYLSSVIVLEHELQQILGAQKLAWSQALQPKYSSYAFLTSFAVAFFKIKKQNFAPNTTKLFGSFLQESDLFYTRKLLFYRTGKGFAFALVQP